MNKEYRCLICNLSFNSARDFSYHLWTHSISQKEYYDKYLKTENDGICQECGNPTEFIKLSKGYRKFCCLSCSNNNKEKQQKAEQTTLKHFGVKHPAQSKIVLDKMSKTTFDNYGVYNISQLSSVSQHKSELMLSNWNEHYDEYINKTISTSLSVYGYKSPNQSPEVQQKQQETCYKNYGVKNCQQSDIVQERTQQTMQDRYGKKFYTQTNEYTEKRIQTSRKRYNVDHPMQCREIMLKTKHKFRKNGKVYDSSWEYYYEQYLILHNIKFEYQPNIYFWYEFNGKKHRYYPDFAIYNDDGSLKEIIDLKGDHLMKQMLDKSTKEHQKYLCILANNIKLLHYQDLEKLGILK